MSSLVKRLRMFAGPNGSGKSTIKSILSPKLLGIYINPDEIEQEIYTRRFLDFAIYNVHIHKEDMLHFFRSSSLLKNARLEERVERLGFSDNRIVFDHVEVNAYFAAVVADFIRVKLLETMQSFSFETVMSHPDKIELLNRARKIGYRTYLYYIATNDPEINIARIRHRVKMGGHPVPEDKVVSRYQNSLDLLHSAVKCTDRAYIFDNSSTDLVWLAEITDGKSLELKVDESELPEWFKTALMKNVQFESGAPL